MALSGDLVAPLTDLCCSGGLPDREPPRQDVGLATRKLSLGYSTDVPCPTASCVEGSGKHGPHTPTGRTTLQIILSALNLYPCRGALPNPMDD